MFKVLLIVYIIGGGNKMTYNSGVEFQEFHSMADCQTVRNELRSLKEDQTYKDKTTIPLYYATRCVPMTSVKPKSTNYGVTADPQPPDEPEPEVVKRKQSRWND